MEEDMDPQPVPEPGEEPLESEAGLFGEKATPEDRVLESDEGKPPWLLVPPRPRSKKPWPKKANFSPYRVKLAGECLQRFAWRYEDKRKDESGYQSGVGKLVHGAYEDAIYRRIKRKISKIPSVATTDELLFLLEFQPAQLLREKENIAVTTSMLEEAKEVIRLGGGLDCDGAWGVEHSFTLSLGRVVIGGFIDMIRVWGNPPRRVVVTDFKSGRMQLPTDRELYSDPQAGLYLAWARDRFPTATDLSFELRNIRLGRSVWLRYRKSHDEIHRNMARSRKYLAESGLRYATPGEGGENCRFCPYREGDENYPACSAYAEILDKTRLRAAKAARIEEQLAKGEEPDKPAGGLGAFELGELMREYRLAKLGEQLNKERKDRLRPEILRRIPPEQKNYRHGDLLASRVKGQRRMSFADVYGLIHALAAATGASVEALAADMLSLKKNELDEFIKGLPEKLQLEADKVIAQHGRLSMGRETLKVTSSKGMF